VPPRELNDLFLRDQTRTGLACSTDFSFSRYKWSLQLVATMRIINPSLLKPGRRWPIASFRCAAEFSLYADASRRLAMN
jgi:hypothetical protein